jgi:hypothetical protein
MSVLSRVVSLGTSFTEYNTRQIQSEKIAHTGRFKRGFPQSRANEIKSEDVERECRGIFSLWIYSLLTSTYRRSALCRYYQEWFPLARRLQV